MDETSTYCKNCETQAEGSYCSSCGQRTSVHTITFKETFSDLASGLFSFEAPFWKTLKLLITNPGKLFREYLLGKRKSYFKPVSFFILLTAIHLLIRSFLDYDPMANVPERENARIALFIEAGQYMVRNINNILFVFVFTLSIFMKFFFYKKYNWAGYMAIAFYLVGLYILIGTVMLFLLKYTRYEFKSLSMVIMLFYFIYAMISFFEKQRLWVLIKSLLVYVLALAFYVILGFGFALLIVYFT